MNHTNIVHKKFFDDEPELTFVEVEQDDDVIAIGEFLESCINGCLSDYDGFGKFVSIINGKKYAIKDIDFSIDEDEVRYKNVFTCSIFYFCCAFNIREVVWVNK